MQAGLHGENGLDPVTSISLLQTYVMPIMFYGLETLIPKGKSFELINKQYKKIIKQVLSLPVNIADPAIYILSGLLPADAIIHKKALNLFGSICRGEETSTEWQLAERQLYIKGSKSNSWFNEIKQLFIKYELGDPYQSLYTSLSKLEWKKLIAKGVNSYWMVKVEQEAKLFTSLKYLSGDKYRIGKCHPLTKTLTASIRDISKIPVRLKLATGCYILQANRANFSRASLSPICLLCNSAEENLEHFLIGCSQLNDIRDALLKEIISKCSILFAKYKLNVSIVLLQVLINPHYYSKYVKSDDFGQDITQYLEPLCRCLCYKLHSRRYELLGLMSKPVNRKKTTKY